MTVISNSDICWGVVFGYLHDIIVLRLDLLRLLIFVVVDFIFCFGRVIILIICWVEVFCIYLCYYCILKLPKAVVVPSVVILSLEGGLCKRWICLDRVCCCFFFLIAIFICWFGCVHKYRCLTDEFLFLMMKSISWVVCFLCCVKKCLCCGFDLVLGCCGFFRV